MEEDTDFDWREYSKYMRELGQKRRASNRKSSADMLSENDIAFTTHNNGAHLIVHGRDSIIDFWPGTGKFISRDGRRKGRGVKRVIQLCEVL